MKKIALCLILALTTSIAVAGGPHRHFNKHKHHSYKPSTSSIVKGIILGSIIAGGVYAYNHPRPAYPSVTYTDRNGVVYDQYGRVLYCSQVPVMNQYGQILYYTSAC